MSKIHDISNYEPSPQDRIFFDSNVWILLLANIAGYASSEQKVYTAFFSKLRRRDVKIAIHSMVVSEYANRLLRNGFNQWKDEKSNSRLDYKRDYVGTDHFSIIIKSIKVHLNQMILASDRFSDEFNSIDLESVLGNFGAMDFNDSYFLEFARMKKYKIVTRDGDFTRLQNAGLDIISIPKKRNK